MGKMRMIFVLSALLMALLLPLAMPAEAAQSDALWFESEVTKEGILVSVYTDAPVVSGKIVFSYDRKIMKFQQLQVQEEFVAQHAINDKSVGSVQIAWVAPKDMSAQGDHVLMQLLFTGEDVSSLTIAGSASTATGESVRVTAPDLAGLEALVKQAQEKKAEEYTADSFAALNAALQEAQDVQKQAHLSPAQVEAAMTKLEKALQALQQPQPETQPNVTEPEEQGSVGLVIAIAAAVLAVGVVTVVVIKKRRGS